MGSSRGFAVWKCIAAPSIFRAASLQAGCVLMAEVSKAVAHVSSFNTPKRVGDSVRLFSTQVVVLYLRKPRPLCCFCCRKDSSTHAKVSQASGAFSGPRVGTITKVTLGRSPTVPRRFLAADCACAASPANPFPRYPSLCLTF